MLCVHFDIAVVIALLGSRLSELFGQLDYIRLGDTHPNFYMIPYYL